MKKVKVLLFAVLIFLLPCICSQQYCAQSKIAYAKKELLQNCIINQNAYRDLICDAFAQFDKLIDDRAHISSYITNNQFQNLLQIQDPANHLLHTSQQLMIAQLHDHICTLHLRQMNQLLQETLTVKKYWQQELVTEKLSKLYKHPAYWLHTKSFQQVIQKKIVLLTNLELDLIKMIGMFFTVQQKMKKLDAADFSKDSCVKTALLLHDSFNSVGSDEPIMLYSNLPFAHDALIQKQESARRVIDSCAPPYHIKQHLSAYSALLLFFVATAVKSYQYYGDISTLQGKAVQAAASSWQEYILNPVKGLKRAVWDYSDENIPKIEVPEDITNCLSTGSFGMRTSVNLIKYALNKELDLINKGIKEVVKRQQINYYLSSIMPLVGFLYVGYTHGRYFYNHESYLKPMCLTVRDIDVLLNKISNNQNEQSFEDSGRLYILLYQLKKSAICLTEEERIRMNEDVEQLLFFDFTCQQKQRVLERMYRTYKFLK